MALLLFARTALAATALLALTPVATGSDDERPELASLVLPLPPDVPPLSFATVQLQAAPASAPFMAEISPAAATPNLDITVTASLGPLARPAEVPPQPEAPPAALAQALREYAGGSLAKGDEAARDLPEGLWRTSAEWAALKSFPRGAGYARIAAFLAAHPAWPSSEWLQKRAEEALFGDNLPQARLRAALDAGPPVSPAGKLAFARLLLADGDTRGAGELAREVWRNQDFNRLIEKTLLDEFSGLLTKADHKYRADRLLYHDDSAAALRAATLAGPDVLALARARAAVVNEVASDALIAAVPPALAKDPGLIFAQIQKLRRAGQFEAAAAALLAAPRDPALLINGDEWWVERRLAARAMLDRGELETAWRLCAEHAAQSPASRIEAEFHAGWIALRFMDDPARARPHFATIAQLAEAPASAARAAYWLGRTQDALGDTGGANAFFASAGRHSASYYGQLARARLGLPDIALRTPPAAARGDDRAEAVQIAEVLMALGAKDIASALVYDSARKLDAPDQIAALAQVVDKAHDARLSLVTGKLASQRGFALDELAFPIFGVPDFVPLGGSAGKALVYAIVRQESAFAVRATSGAGARGLMQLMVPTARKTAQKAGIDFDAARLTSDPAFNTQLGAAHLGTLFEEHDGSYVLAFAAYNAGGGRVKEWITAYGDPRRPEIDVVDWIELIPITETRQYVQHILENLQIYRARLDVQSVRLIDADLHAHGSRF